MNSEARTMCQTRHRIVSVIFGVALVCTLLLLYFARTVVIVSLLGVGIGVLVSPLLGLLRRRLHFPRALSAFVLFLMLSLFFGGLAYGIVVVAADQVSALSTQVPQILARLSQFLDQALERFPWLRADFESLRLAEIAQTTLSRLSSGLISSGGAISGFVFALIIGLYTAVDERTYFESILAAIPQRRRSEARRFLEESAAVLRQWFRAQLMDMVIVGSLTAFGLWLVGAPYWVLFGLLTAVFGIIPYIGVLLLVTIATLVTLAADPSRVPWVIGVFFLTQQIEGNLILPLVMKGKADLPEVPLLIFMLLFGSWLGLFGVFLAPPLFAVVRVAYRRFYLSSI